MAHDISGDILELPFEVFELIIFRTRKGCGYGFCEGMLIARSHSQRLPSKWLDSYPWIAGYIRSFEYIHYWGIHDHNCTPWPFLRNTTSIAFGGSGILIRGQPTHGKLEGSLRTSFCNFLSSNAIKELDLFRISDFPVTLFLQIPYLISLKILELSFVHAKDRASFQKAKLTRLSVYDVSPGDLKILLGERTSPFDLTQLRELSVGSFDELLDTDAVERLISTSEKIRTLSLEGESCNCRILCDDLFTKYLAMDRSGSTKPGPKYAAGRSLEDTQGSDHVPTFIQRL
ncbi:hypothetical protein M413DRAFT_26764 [Hebeloma cylindrosporum]|uniref:Uncharacterized protein n=1 Tax=Hebeloma cylindrosporum TaxID=76867 RepID=A0A0C2YP10_HEBCY|nr:hypothetical protein M413DRAFT_26764 [Hebeloma cylindrosporum h7]